MMCADPRLPPFLKKVGDMHGLKYLEHVLDYYESSICRDGDEELEDKCYANEKNLSIAHLILKVFNGSVLYLTVITVGVMCVAVSNRVEIDIRDFWIEAWNSTGLCKDVDLREF